MSWECLIVPKKKHRHKWIETDFPTFCSSSNNHGSTQPNQNQIRVLYAEDWATPGFYLPLKEHNICSDGHRCAPPFLNREIHEIRWILAPEVPFDTLGSRFLLFWWIQNPKKNPKMTQGIRKVQFWNPNFPHVAKKWIWKILVSILEKTIEKLPFFSDPKISHSRWVARWPAFWVTRWVPSLLRRRREGPKLPVGLLRVGW